MIDLLRMVESLPDQEGKAEILDKVRELAGEKELPVYSLVLGETPRMAYDVYQDPDGTWRWSWEDEGGEPDGCCGFTTYRDAVRAVKKDVQENLACDYDERVRLLQTLDEEVR